MSNSPNWLRHVHEKYGTNIPMEKAQLLYRPALTWKEHNAWCRKGNQAALLTHLQREDHPVERECFFLSTIEMTYRTHPHVAAAIGLLYVEEFYKAPEPFGPGHRPSGQILKRLVLLLDPSNYEDDEKYTGSREHAIWVCKFALASGVSDDTKKGFGGRLELLEQQSTDPQ